MVIQSMTNTDTRDVEATVHQILALEDAGCQVIRSAVVDEEAAAALEAIVRRIHIPMVADIHFDYRLALKAMESGVQGIRINPGNIGGIRKLRQVVEMAKERNIPIRVGVNGGSLEKEILHKHGGPTPEALVESAMGHVSLMEELGYGNLKISIKSSNVPTFLKANRLLAKVCDYPIHLGVTEAGVGQNAVIKSALGIGTLLAEGIGDTIRVSLTGDPLEEVRVARSILDFLELSEKPGPELISCPTCGRTEIDLEHLARSVEKMLETVDRPIRVAVMGCPVNGPGEAREADLGLAGGKGQGLIFKKGQIVAKVPAEELLSAFARELEEYIRELEQEV